MSNLKWCIFGLIVLALLAAGAVWYVERKIAQVSGMVDGTVEDVREAVYAPVTATKQWASDSLTSARKWNAETNEALEGSMLEKAVSPFAQGGAKAIDFIFGLEE